MGRPKPLLPVAGTTLVEWQVGRLAGSFAATVIAVATKDQLPAVLQPSAVVDRTPGRGPLSGLEAGLEAARTPVVFALGCDVPSVTIAQARLLVGALAAGADAAVARTPAGLEPMAAAYRRDPARRAVAAAIAAGELRLRDLLHRLEAVEVELPAVVNLNTPAEYQAFLDN
jgi:molybdopterin-guanine dinucleotide biosynthesis protein A